MNGRAYYSLNGRWHRVYVLATFEQTTLLGGIVKMATIKLTKAGKAIDIELDKLTNEKPGRKKYGRKNK